MHTHTHISITIVGSATKVMCQNVMVAKCSAFF